MTKLEARIFHLEAAFARLLVQYAADTGKKDDIGQIFGTFVQQTEKLGGLSEDEVRKVIESEE